MKIARATALCLVILAIAVPVLATPLNVFSCENSSGSCVPIFDSPDVVPSFEAQARPRIDALSPVSLALILNDAGQFKKVFYRALDGQYYAWHARDFATLVFGADVRANGVNLANLLRRLRMTTEGDDFDDILDSPGMTTSTTLDPLLADESGFPPPATAATSNPEPATLLLFGSGLVAMATAIRKSRRSDRPRR